MTTRRSTGPAALLRRAWRRTGADLPFGDPRPAHGTGTEGWFWRFTAADGRVVAVACALTRHAGRVWGLAALGAGPGGPVAYATTGDVRFHPDRFELRIGDLLHHRDGRLRVDLGPRARLAADLVPLASWPRRALHGLGPASVLPGLGQYWHPHLFGARVRGGAEVGGAHWPLDGAQAYAEKNWGPAFPGHWWWGQAQGFEDPGVCVAFAGGELAVGPATARPTSVAVSLGGPPVRLVPPLAAVRASVRDGRWELTARGPRTLVRLRARTPEAPAHPFPVPAAGPHAVAFSAHHLTAGLELRVERDGRTLFAGRTAAAGLELGGAPARPAVWPSAQRTAVASGATPR